MATDTRKRLLQLREQLHEHNYSYHVLNSPSISDADYDRMFHELQELEMKHPEMTDANSPSARVGGLGPSAFQKVKHSTRMLSLENMNKPEDVIDFFGEGEAVMVEPKIDGLSLEARYVRGRLEFAVTRGDGTVGEDVTQNARTIHTLPLVLTQPVDLRVRGEVYMTLTTFHRLNEQLELEEDDLFANPRNAASGSLKLKDSSVVAARSLSFVAYGSPDELPEIEDQYGLVDYLEMLGFHSVLTLPVIVDSETLACEAELGSAKEVKELLDRCDVLRKKLDLPTDGLVFKVMSRRKQRELGDGTRGPHWAAAYKYPPERKPTRLTAITLSVGKTGKITPNAEFQPLNLSGTTVSRASLCNQDEIERLGVNIGDEVYVEKSAEIIPKVVGVARKLASGVFKMPDKCPCCGGSLVRPEGFVDYYCPNDECEEQVFARLKHTTSKAALDLDGCGDSMIRELMRYGVRDLLGLLTLPEDKIEMKKAAKTKFLEGRIRVYKAPLWRKLHALNIEGFGSTLCQEIAGRWRSLAGLMDEIDEFNALVKEVRSKAFAAYVKAYAGQIDQLESLGFVFEDEDRQEGPLTGKVFVITGDMQSGRREEVVKWIEQAGGMVKSGVSKNVHYLVVGDNAGRTKTDAAAKHGTAQINEEQLFQMMGRSMPSLEQGVGEEEEDNV